MSDPEMSFEHLGRAAFNCHGKRCDPLRLVDADTARDFFKGTLKGKQTMSAIIVAFSIIARQNNNEDILHAFRELHHELWAMEEYDTSQGYTRDRGISFMERVKQAGEFAIGKTIFW